MILILAINSCLGDRATSSDASIRDGRPERSIFARKAVGFQIVGDPKFSPGHWRLAYADPFRSFPEAIRKQPKQGMGDSNQPGDGLPFGEPSSRGSLFNRSTVPILKIYPGQLGVIPERESDGQRRFRHCSLPCFMNTANPKS